MADISVVIPCFNSSRELPRALESVRRQTLLPRDVVVVDDGSADQAATEALVAGTDAPFPVRLISFPRNRGASAARNAGVSATRGEYVAFLDADDVWHPRKLELQHGVMLRQGLSICGHGYVRLRRAAFEGEPPAAPKVVRIGLSSFLARNPLFTPTVIVRRNVFVAFDERLRRSEDYKAWMMTCATPGIRGAYIDAVLAGGFKALVGASGLSGSIPEMHQGALAALRSLRTDAPSIPLGFVASAMMIEHLKYPLRVAVVALRRSLER